jgi:hypothetical protein
MFPSLTAPLQSLKGRFFIAALLASAAASGATSAAAPAPAPVSAAAQTASPQPKTPTASALTQTAAAQPLSQAASAQSKTPTASALTRTAAAWDENREVRLKGDRLEYYQDGDILQGSGDVVLDNGVIRVRADTLELDLRSNTLTASGKVVWCQDGNTIYADSIQLNLKNQTGSAHGMVFRHDSWAAWGDSAEKTSDKDLEISQSESTSCLREHPHYRLRAREIRARLGDKIWMKDVVVFIGVAPLFYLPYYSQSLRDGRAPYEIRPGYNSVTGAFVRGAYNFYFSPDEWGSVRVDWMDKLGTGYGLSDHYRFLGGEGSAAGYVTRDKNDPGDPSWTGTFSHRQDLGHGHRLLGNVDLISQYQMNTNYDLNQADTAQNRSNLTLQSTQKTYSWSLGMSETQVLQPTFGADPTGTDKEYVVSARTFPSFSFSHNTLPLFKGSALYWGYSAQASRSLIVPQTLSVYQPQSNPLAVTQSVSLFDLGQSYYNDVISVTPGLSHSQRLPHGSALSTSLGVTGGFAKDEEGPVSVSLVSSAALNEVLHVPLTHTFTTQFGWSYTHALSHAEALPFSGLEANQLSYTGNWAPNQALSLLSSTYYNLLPYQTDSDLKRLGLISLQGLFSPSLARSFSLTGAYQAQTGQIQDIDTSINLNGPKKRWQLSTGSSWVNSRIQLEPASTLDPNAPQEYSFQQPRQTPDQMLVNWRANFAVTEHWGLSAFQSLNVASRNFQEQAFSVRRDLHCWDIEVYGRDLSSTGWQFGFTLTLRANPKLTASSTQLTSDLFKDTNFGY